MALLKSFGADVLAANVAKRQAYHDVRLGIAQMDNGEPVVPGKQSKSKRAQKASKSPATEKVPDKVIEVPEEDIKPDESAKDIEVDKNPEPGKAE
ncbi:gp38 [Shigella phage Buco]|uniref:Uncharacterized protein n=1 Tax=Shigella phage Buco TaxID=2530183 RepID=A0A482JG70_9CAUD|nr:gp38 [Shigella phage Buco]QBP32938.1 hypothetical protein HRP29_gp38 [Shigella phage Buco]